VRSLWLVLTLATAVAGAAFYAGQQVEAGKQYDREVQVVVESIAVLDTVYKTDTLRLTRWRTKYDTLVETRDIHDTVWVKEFIAVADTTIKLCTAALRTCEQREALQAKRADLAERKLKSLTTGQEKKERQKLLLGAALGLVGGVLLTR
jgi:glucokinase